MFVDSTTSCNKPSNNNCIHVKATAYNQWLSCQILRGKNSPPDNEGNFLENILKSKIVFISWKDLPK